jgi:hypothetical protein
VWHLAVQRQRSANSSKSCRRQAAANRSVPLCVEWARPKGRALPSSDRRLPSQSEPPRAARADCSLISVAVASVKRPGHRRCRIRRRRITGRKRIQRFQRDNICGSVFRPMAPTPAVVCFHEPRGCVTDETDTTRDPPRATPRSTCRPVGAVGQKSRSRHGHEPLADTFFRHPAPPCPGVDVRPIRDQIY